MITLRRLFWFFSLVLLTVATSSAWAQITFTFTDLGTLGGTTSSAGVINASGQVVGSSQTAGNVATHAVVWDNGTATDLGALAGLGALALALIRRRAVPSASASLPRWPLVRSIQRMTLGRWLQAPCLAFGFFLTTAAPAQIIMLTGIGTATIDGVINPSEWAQAGSTTFTGIYKPGYLTTTTATIFAMNDATNLYLAASIGHSGAGGTLAFLFINSGVGTEFSTGDNAVLVGSDGNYVSDNFHTPTSEGESDTFDNGTSEGSGAFTSNATTSYYELSFPLSSGDNAHDFSLSADQSVRFQTVFQLVDIIDSNWTDARTYAAFVQFTTSSVPEPSGLAAFAGLFVLGFATLHRRQKRLRATAERVGPERP